MSLFWRLICAAFGHSAFCGLAIGHPGECACARCGEPIGFDRC